MFNLLFCSIDMNISNFRTRINVFVQKWRYSNLSIVEVVDNQEEQGKLAIYAAKYWHDRGVLDGL